MKEFKGTKGEWVVKHFGSADWDRGISIEPTNFSLYGDTEIDNEDAKLIAAAPDLLEALQYFLEEGESRHTIKKAKEAINKALN